MTRRYVPFAFAGIVVAWIANAAIPRPAAPRPPLRPVAPMETELESDEPLATETDGGGNAGTPPIELPARSAAWLQRHAIVPRASLERDDPRLEFSDIHSLR